MSGRGFAAVLVVAAALATLIASGGAGAQSGDENQCVGGTTTGSTDGLQMCTITVSPGKCIQKSSSPVIVQTCVVTQTETENEVYVEQVNSSSLQGSMQDATQVTTITQEGRDNRADVNQDIRQTTHESTSTGTITQKQDGHQSTTICQGGDPCATTPNDGVNVANVTQSRWADAHASGGTIEQLQDSVGLGDDVTDCDTAKPPLQADLCANIVQNSSTRNDATLHQDDHLLAEASGATGTVTQTQGSGDGGIDGNVLQPTTETAQNTNDTHEHLTYDLSGPETAVQTQDPRIACCTGQGGSDKSKTSIHQVGILRAPSTAAVQHLGIDGLCASNGSCLVLQHGKINDANFTTRCSAEGSGCTANIECQSAGEIDSTPATCAGFPPKGNPPDFDLASLGFDTLDFQDAINFTFPLNLPGL